MLILTNLVFDSALTLYYSLGVKTLQGSHQSA